MEIIIALIVIVVVGAIIYVNREAKTLDLNEDGKVDAADAKAAIQKTVDAVRNAGDVNKDGKVDAADVKVATTKAKTAVKKAAVKAKTAVRKTARAK
jgi:hypothetical protein